MCISKYLRLKKICGPTHSFRVDRKWTLLIQYVKGNTTQVELGWIGEFFFSSLHNLDKLSYCFSLVRWTNCHLRCKVNIFKIIHSNFKSTLSISKGGLLLDFRFIHTQLVWFRSTRTPYCTTRLPNSTFFSPI